MSVISESGRDVISVLEKHCSLEWYRYRSIKSPDQHIYPPVVIWRYDNDIILTKKLSLINEIVRQTVDNFVGNTKWVCYFTGRNWVLLPERVKKMEESGKYKTDSEIMKFLSEKEPSFGRAANEDIPKIAKSLDDALK